MKIASHSFRWLASLALIALLCLALWPASARAEADGTAFSGALALLPAASFAEKEQAVAAIGAARHPQSRRVLAAFLDGRLYADAAGRVLVAVEGEGPLDAQSGEPVAGVTEADLSRIGTNNRLRKVLRGAIARFDLADESVSVRAAAVREMGREADADVVALLRAHQQTESSTRVREAIITVLALADLTNDEAAVRFHAVQMLDGVRTPEVHNRLTLLLARDDAGNPVEPDAAVRAAALVQVRSIDSWRSFYQAVETLFFGLSLGSVLVLAAIGLTITFGVMGVINMAHGELIMIGAYTTYVMQLLLPNHIALSVLLSIPAAFLVSGLFGVAIERGIVRHLYGRPLETLLATFGLSLILQQLVRSVFSPLNRSVKTPEFMSGSLQINEMFSLTYNRLYIVVFALVVFALLMLVLNRTSLGLKVRAVSQNRAMASAMGIRTSRIDALTFGLGSGIAGVAGVALSQLTNVGPNLGQAYIIDSFMVVVFGGVGNLWGTLISGMSLGVINKLLEPWAGAVMAKILVLVFLILFIQRKPRGLFPQKGRSAEGH